MKCKFRTPFVLIFLQIGGGVGECSRWFDLFPSLSDSVKIGCLQNRFLRGLLMRFDTIIRAGTVVTATDSSLADLGINGDKVTAIAAHLPPENAGPVIDAPALLLIPAGIVAHTH